MVFKEKTWQNVITERKRQAVGIYLNSTTAYTLYRSETRNPYFVDKSRVLEELFPLIRRGNQHICITRPRRFGKTVMANMIAAYFSRGCDSSDVFQNLAIAHSPEYEQYRNKFFVIHISFNDIGDEYISYEKYIGRIQEHLPNDLKREYPDVELFDETDVVDILMDINAENPKVRN